jgi:hypothetical protein
MKMFICTFVSLFLVALLVGCDTPSYRIGKNQDMFDSFAPDVQANLRQSKIDIGYTKDMAFIAFGKPNREYTRLSDAGMTEVWSYTDVYLSSDRQRVSGTFRVRDSSGHVRTVNDTIWVDVDREHEYEVRRIEFEDGVVRAVEQVKKH